MTAKKRKTKSQRRGTPGRRRGEPEAVPVMEPLEDQPVPVSPRGSGLTGGDVDADWARAESAGEEAVGGSAATPDQDVVDEIGRALGVEQGSEAEVVTSEEILRRRDRFRWHLERDAEERERRTEEEPEERRARERGEATPP
jgi:hypothetical protein